MATEQNQADEAANDTGFRLLHRDSSCSARRGLLCTERGTVQTPAFMPVGTLGSVKGLLPEMVRATGAEIILGNTYHLALRPGEDVVRDLGGLHAFMNWSGPILTDSGGFQVFSLAQITTVSEQAAVFRSHIDGRLLELSPERAVAIQEALGSDITMVLDDVVALPAATAAVRQACERTVRWAERSRRAVSGQHQMQFAIVQGGLDTQLRLWCTERLVEMEFAGYAIGGLSVGESMEQMYRIVASVAPALPDDRPRYLMGVGRPQDILEAVRHGVDMFDCVMPTRNGRNGLAFTDAGPLRLRNLKHQRDPQPLEQHCPCPACRYSRGYLRHLFMAGEMLGPILLSVHNLTYYQRLLAGAREAIANKRFLEYQRDKLAGWELGGRLQ